MLFHHFMHSIVIIMSSSPYFSIFYSPFIIYKYKDDIKDLEFVLKVIQMHRSQLPC
jgi:hypothetical protein